MNFVSASSEYRQNTIKKTKTYMMPPVLVVALIQQPPRGEGGNDRKVSRLLSRNGLENSFVKAMLFHGYMKKENDNE